MPKILMKRSGNLISAVPDGMDIGPTYRMFESELSYNLKVRNDYQTAKRTRSKYRFERQLVCKLVHGDDDDYIVYPAGMQSRVIDMLTRMSVSWSMKDYRRNLLPDPQMKLMELDKIREDQENALLSIFANDMGVIEAPTAYGKTFIICQLCRAYPTSNIIVCSYRKDVVDSIFNRLKAHVRGRDLGIVGGGHRSPGRVTVSTVDSLPHAQPEKCQLLLYDEVHEAGSPERARKIARIRGARVFGFSASPKGRSDGSDMAVEALFGPVIYTLKYQEAEADGVVASIKVHAVRVDGVPIPYSDDVSQFRFGIWRNEYRNSLIAAEAAKHAADGKQVLIVVDKVEHALALKAKYLPHWPVVHGNVAAEQIRSFKKLNLLPKGERVLCTKQQRGYYRERFERGQMKYAIATGVWSQGVDFVHLDVLVRGDGRSSPIGNTQIPGRLSRGSEGLLIDFDDVFDERFQRRSATRFTSYKSKGWEFIKS